MSQRSPLSLLVLLTLAACSDDKSPVTDDTDGQSADDSATSDDSTADSDATDDSATDDTGPPDSSCGGDASRRATMNNLVTAVETFSASLSAELLAEFEFEMDDPERMDWDNRPINTYPRAGVAFGDLDAAQKALAYDLLGAVMSADGFSKASGIITVDQYEADAGETNMGEQFYYLDVFGTPSLEGVWGLQLDGHHLAISWTMADCKLVGTPTFLGVRPTELTDGASAGLRPLGDLSDLAFAFTDALTADQLALLVVSTTSPADLSVGPHMDGMFPTEHVGLPAGELDTDQQAMLLDLIYAYVGVLPAPYGEQHLTEVAATLDDTTVAWMGDIDSTKQHYYRIDGPGIWIEYNLSGAADHVHAIWRDPLDDYGEDLLAEHYAAFPHEDAMPARPARPIWELAGVDALLARPLSETRDLDPTGPR